MSEVLRLRLDGLAFGGEAVGRDASGRVVFVAGGAPGDLVDARLVEKKKKFARAELVAVVEPGARVEPPCPIAGECGGCPWMHVAPEAQLAAKQAIVARALAPSGAEVLPIAAAPAWLGYRVRARFTARSGRMGFFARHSQRVVDVAACPALAPPLDAAMGAARRLLGAKALGEGGTLAGRVAPDGSVQLDVDPGEGADRRAIDEVAARLVDERVIVGLTISGHPARGAATLDLGGGVGGAAAGFAQANAGQNAFLQKCVFDAVSPSESAIRVLELYAGDGNFTVELARRAAHVTAVEGDRAAAARLVENLRAAVPPDRFPERFRVRAESVADAVRSLARAGERFDLALLDPPRAGAADALDDLAALAPRTIVYVSCDPMTLARDLARLAELGYVARRAQPIDMMPHTAHIEVVVTLAAAAASG